MTGRASSSFRQGIWMISFMAEEDVTVRGSWRVRRSPGAAGLRDSSARTPVEVDTLAKVAFAVLCVGFLVGFLVFPTYPNYDSYYSLLWGREVLDLQAPFFEGFRVPDRAPARDRRGRAAVAAGRGRATASGWR